MMLSEGRQTHFAHVVVDGIYDDDLVDFVDDDRAMRAAKKALQDFIKEEEVIDQTVRHKLLSQKKAIIEGTTEWDTVYGKYYQEELNRRGFK